MKKGLISKLLLVALPLLFLGFLVPTHAAHAGWLDNVFSPAKLVGSIAFIVGWAISAVGGVLVMIITWAVGVILTISMNLVNSPMVQIGFPVVLSLANLGFVLVLIGIGIATIVRWQEYGISKLLGKLIIMAVVVNFGLVIAGVILNFSDSITIYFLDHVSPSGSGTSIVNFASSLGGAFQPQQFIPGQTNVEALKGVEDIKDINGWSAAGSSVGSIIAPLAGILFAIAGNIIIVITLGALVVMLLIRYIWLGFLLVVLPFAWMLNAVPGKYSGQYKTWWDKFISQAFFPPVVVFFLWLAMMLAQQMNAKHDMIPIINSDAGGLAGTIGTFVTNVFGPVITNFMGGIIISGIMIGGLMMAKGMGAGFAATAMNGATKVGDWAKGKASGMASRTGQRAAGRVMQSERAKTALQKMQRAGADRGKLGRALTAPARWIGRGGQELAEATSPAAKESYRKLAKDLSDEALIAQIPVTRGGELYAYLEEAKSRKGGVYQRAIAAINKKDPNALKERLDPDLAKRFGAEDIHKDTMSESGLIIPDIEQRRKIAEYIKNSAEVEAEAAAMAETTDGEKAEKAKRKQELEETKKKVSKMDEKEKGEYTVDKLDKEEAAYYAEKMSPELFANLLAGKSTGIEKGKPGYEDEGYVNEKGREPMGLSTQDLRERRKTMARHIAKNASPSRFAKMIAELSPEQQINFTRDAINAGIKWEDINRPLQNYLIRGMQNGIVDADIFGVKPPQENKEVDTRTAEEKRRAEMDRREEEETRARGL